MKEAAYWNQKRYAVNRKELDGLGHTQLKRQRGLRGIKLGPANEGRRLSAEERQEIEASLRQAGKL